MFKNNKKEIFSIRKFKNGRSDSVKVGASILLALLTTGNNLAPVIAAEINENQLPEVVSSTDKVATDKKVSFKNAAGKTVFSVDAVLDQDVAESTKANNNTGTPDGTDTLNIKSEAKVNYILDEDKSKLKDSKTVETGSGTIKTPYDKKGLAYDTDGKDYRKSVVDKGGLSVTEEAGKEEVIKANGKAYQLQRSEVVDKDKVKYDKTTFNDIEATVSPEDMHNELGEIDYTKIKGKVYLVEETSEGQYGKFVEANNITSDAEAVQAWQNGQATAKEFTKANVTLQEGDTIIVMDKDTYATTIGNKREHRKEHPTVTYTVFSESVTNRDSYAEAFTYSIDNRDLTFYEDTQTYALVTGSRNDNILNQGIFTYTTSGVETRILNSGADKIFGTSDDETEDVINKTYDYVTVKLPTEVTNQLNIRNAKLDEILKAIKFKNYKDLNDIVKNDSIPEADKTDIINYNAPIEDVVIQFKEFIKDNNIKVGIDNNNNLVFYSSNITNEKIELLKQILQGTHTIDFSSSLLEKIKTPGADKTFGTSDDGLYYVGKTLKAAAYVDIPVDTIKNATTKEIIKKLKEPAYRGLNFIKESVTTEDNKTKVQEKETELNNVVNEIEKFITDNNIKIGINNNQLIFYTANINANALNKLEEKIRKSDDIVKNINIQETNVETLADYEGHGSVRKTTTNHVFFDGDFIKETHINYYSLNDKTSDVDYSTVIYESNSEEKLSIKDPSNATENWTSSFSSDGTERISKSSTGYTNGNYTGEIDKEIRNKKKEIITPIRAYKVVSDGVATVNHYYTLKTEPEELKETVETKGSVVVKYVDQNGKEIKTSNTVVPETVIKTVKKYETKSDTTVVSSREDVIDNTTPYNTKSALENEIRTEDGKIYRYRAVLPTDNTLNNTTDETGNVKEGVTTVIYQYDLIIPVDPTKPNEGQTTPPKPTDKIPNDPQGRTYADLGLVKNVERNITYVYENGPKAGQEASTPVKQEARFTRTAEINARTGEVTYKTEWTPTQKLNEVVSPTKAKYVADKDKVEELTVSNTSENTNVVVKYRENPDVIDHDADKDKKGTVKVKHIDDKGNLLEEETVKDNVVVATTTTKVYADRDPETTYTPTNEKYSTIDRRKESIEKDKIKYKFSKLVEVTPELNNTTEEEGTVKEGITTVVYQYDYIIPVDPTKPNEGETTPPKPTDKVPGDPKGRTYGNLDLVKNVERNITYVYENGPKSGQEASKPVKQEARFTRTAEINRRTGEVIYTSDWTSSQKLNEVKSPTIQDYVVDKEKVEELTVSNTSENTNVVVKYKEGVKYIEHDADKDKKGSVIVKYVDANGTVLKEVKVKENVVVAKASTKIYTNKEETTYTATNEKYSVEKEKEFTIDGIKFVFNKLVPVNSKYNNTTEESGVIKEGITTVVYEYKPVLPSNDIVNEKPEFNGGVTPVDPPVVDIPEYKEPIGGAIVPPEVHEKPEFKGGVSPIDPPVVEKPEVEVPKVETPKAEEPKKEEPKEVIKKKEELPVTSSSSMLGMFGLVGAFGLRKKRKKDK